MAAVSVGFSLTHLQEQVNADDRQYITVVGKSFEL
jgi:hypothetical protein